VARLIVSAPERGIARYGLTAGGRERVRRTVAEAMTARVLRGPVEVVASPFLRAAQTARIAADLLGVEPRSDERLCERFFGSLEGTGDEGYERVWAADRLDPEHGEWGVESVAKVARRTLEMVRELEASPRRDPVLLVTHGDPASILVAALAGDLGRHRELCALPVAGLRRLG